MIANDNGYERSTHGSNASLLRGLKILKSDIFTFTLTVSSKIKFKNKRILISDYVEQQQECDKMYTDTMFKKKGI